MMLGARGYVMARNRRTAAFAVAALVAAGLGAVGYRALAQPEPSPVEGSASAASSSGDESPDDDAPVFPGPDDTGVPPGTELEPYAGPCTLVETVTLSGVDATGVCPAIVVQAPGVRIEDSRVPRVESTATQVDPTFSVEVVDSDVVAGEWIGGAVWGTNITVRRTDVTGGQHSVHCGSDCVVEDSWLHDQFNPEGEAAHNNAFITNGGTDMVVRHNTLHCTSTLNATGGGCTADLSLFGDFEPVRDVLVENNLLKANGESISFCAYGGDAPGKPFPEATGIVFRGNVFERGTNDMCGVYGPVTSFNATSAGNAWQDNTWDDGSPLTP
ncbi:hypothetical protein ASC64_04175 [Nocardioides sp. Root122]|nr:hypothetical protein ASC64_04175 [Nocardioides sp. Root122]